MTQTSTATQTTAPACGGRHGNWTSWNFTGEPETRRGTCTACDTYVPGMAAKYDTVYQDACTAYFALPSTVALLTDIANRRQARHIKFARMGRRGLVVGADIRY